MYTRYERNPVYIIQAVNNKTEMNVSGSKRTRYMECITMKITEDIIYVGVNCLLYTSVLYRSGMED